MELFEMRNGKAFPSVHALMIHPFKEIWETDKSENRGEAVLIFTYVELVCNPKKSNPFAGYDEKIRPSKVRKEVWGDENYPHPKFSQIIQAVMKYKEMLPDSSPSYNIYSSALNAADEVKNFLDSVDLTERTSSGMPVYKPADVLRALNEIPNVIKNLTSLQDKVHEELVEAAKTRNQREVGLFER